MKHILLSLSALSLCACSIAMETTEPVIESIALNEKSTAKGIICTATGVYPRISGLSSRQVELNIEGLIELYIYEIREGIRICPSQLEDITEDDTELTDSTDVDFKVTRLDDQYFSVVIVSSQYFEGAAHPNNTIDTMVFDLSTGQYKELEDWFDRDEDYETTLTEFVQKDLEERGLGDYPSDMSNSVDKYYLTDDAIVLVDLFGTHAQQAIEVEVPLAEIIDHKI